MARTNRRTIAVVASLALGVGVAGVACVIADPPAQLPVAPLTRPVIVHDGVFPAQSVLTSWPLEFLIPIEVQDPTSAVEWHEFLDYDPVKNTGFVTQGTLDPDPAGDDGGVRLLSQRFAAPVDLNVCHTLEVIIALNFDSDHTPGALGGDSITWIYTPTGSLSGCPVYDAGPYDASVDASDGADDDGGDGAGG